MGEDHLTTCPHCGAEQELNAHDAEKSALVCHNCDQEISETQSVPPISTMLLEDVRTLWQESVEEDMKPGRTIEESYTM